MKFYKNKIFYACVMDDEFWIRFYFLSHKKYDGFRIININEKTLRFSERLKLVNTTQILNYNFKKLRPIEKVKKELR